MFADCESVNEWRKMGQVSVLQSLKSDDCPVAPEGQEARLFLFQYPLLNLVGTSLLGLLALRLKLLFFAPTGGLPIY